MVYKIFIDGENYEHGVVYFSKLLSNVKYGLALQEVEKLLSMIDEGVAGVLDANGIAVYVANKTLTNINRVEL